VTPGNSQKIPQLQQTWKELLEEALKPGFHGTVSVELKVQDGTIQDIRRKVERVDK
jgi:hypothetical protein